MSVYEFRRLSLASTKEAYDFTFRKVNVRFLVTSVNILTELIAFFPFLLFNNQASNQNRG